MPQAQGANRGDQADFSIIVRLLPIRFIVSFSYLSHHVTRFPLLEKHVLRRDSINAGRLGEINKGEVYLAFYIGRHKQVSSPSRLHSK